MYILSTAIACQRTKEISGRSFAYYQPSEGNIYLSDEVTIPLIPAGYTAWIPSGKVKGTIVFMHANADTSSRDPIVDYAWEKDMAVIYVTTDNRLEFLFDTSKMLQLESLLQRSIERHNLPADKMLFCGMSLAGTRAMKMSLFAQASASRHRIAPAAIAICDAPLDFKRFYRSMIKAASSDFHPTATDEGKWVSSYLRTHLGGSPENNKEAYDRFSPYSHDLDRGGQGYKFNSIPIRCYTEPDIEWWMRERGKDYYDMNAIDMAGIVNLLKHLGNEKAELIITTNRGYFPDGRRHPHSWSIVHEEKLVDWFAAIIN